MTNSGTQRAELHKTIWSIANVLRGSVDGWDFKQYVLGFLFYRFISEDITSYLNGYEHQAGDVDFDYAKLDDATAEQVRKSMVEEKGYFILPSDLFANVRRCADADENLNETLQRVFKNIEGSAIGSRSESSLRGLFDDLDLGTESFADNKIDAFGDAYEYLMTMYAANAGKSGGEFFTPQEVSELLTRIATHGKSEVNKVYDPACGSGSLLLQSIKVLGKDKVRQGFFGQEKNLTTYNLCRINMFLHDVNYDHFNIAYGDTLINPQHWDDEPFEVIVSNPPYSTKWEGDDNPTLINDPRFSPAGVLAPKSKADLAFTMHMLSWLAADGTAAIVEFPGVLYRGGKEQKIRKYLLEGNFIDAVIQLPPNLFFGTSIATCIIVLKKSKTDDSVLFIDASERFVHVGNQNQLSPDDIAAIMDAYVKREPVEHFSAVASLEDIRKNDYVLSVSGYVQPKDTREKIDIAALNRQISDIVARENELRTQIDAIIADLES